METVPFNYQELVNDSVKLISLPDIYLRVRVILNNSGASAKDLAEALGADPGLTVRLLRLANSPFYGFQSRVETISRAVALLGSRQVHDIVLATSVARSFQGMGSKLASVTDFWRSSVYSALTARILAKRCQVLDCERLFVYGLLRDIGHLLIYQQLPEQAESAIRKANADNVPIADVEQELFGFDFAQVGCELLRVWDLPEAMHQAVRWQGQPEQAGNHRFDASILHIVAGLTDVMHKEDDLSLLELPWSADALTLTNVSEDDLANTQKEGADYLQEACRLLLPQSIFSDRTVKAP